MGGFLCENRAIAFNCNESEAIIRSRRTPSVTIGQSTIYIGYQQVSATNKDPRLIRFDAGRRVWCKTNYEVTGDDSTGYGLVWNGGDIYAVFSSTGTQGSSSQDFRRFTTNGWLTSYGDGGGAKVAILARINAFRRRSQKSDSAIATGMFEPFRQFELLSASV